MALKPEKVAVSASGTMKMGVPDMAATEGVGRLDEELLDELELGRF